MQKKVKWLPDAWMDMFLLNIFRLVHCILQHIERAFSHQNEVISWAPNPSSKDLKWVGCEFDTWNKSLVLFFLQEKGGKFVKPHKLSQTHNEMFSKANFSKMKSMNSLQNI